MPVSNTYNLSRPLGSTGNPFTERTIIDPLTGQGYSYYVGVPGDQTGMDDILRQDISSSLPQSNYARQTNAAGWRTPYEAESRRIQDAVARNRAAAESYLSGNRSATATPEQPTRPQYGEQAMPRAQWTNANGGTTSVGRNYPGYSYRPTGVAGGFNPLQPTPGSYQQPQYGTVRQGNSSFGTMPSQVGGSDMALFNGGAGQQGFSPYQSNQPASYYPRQQQSYGPPQQFTGGLDPVFVRRPQQRMQAAMPEYNQGYQFNQQPQQQQQNQYQNGGLAGGIFAPGYQGNLNDAFPAQQGGMSGGYQPGSQYQGLAGPGYSSGSYRSQSIYQAPTQYYQYGSVNGVPFGNQYAMPSSGFQNTKYSQYMQ